MTNELKNKIYAFLGNLNTEVDINALVDVGEINFSDAYQSIFEMVRDNDGFSIEIIYYADAMKYLSDYDNSLRESLSIAYEMGYEVKNLNSELLASLLASRNAEEQFSNLETEINEFFESL